MKLHAQQGARGKVIDLDTRLPVRKVIWVDEEKGEIEAYQVGIDGEIRTGTNEEGITCYLTYKAKGRFKWMPLNQVGVGSDGYPSRTIGVSTTARSYAPSMGAPTCSICKSSLTLPGEELCPGCCWDARHASRAASLGRPQGMRVERILDPFLPRRCHAPGCGRPATYAVADEVECSPQIGMFPINGISRKRLFTRGAMVGRRYYCAWHFKPPRILDAKGQIVEELDHSHGVRPQ